ncbi:MAG: hypothetical protein IT429_17815 [Gemmataceae bacterium]|nr:hypothetical protein [Gemmataceae bacterium]
MKRILGTPGARPALVGAGTSAVCVALLLAFATLKTEGTALYADPGWDRHLYRAMAEGNPFTFGLAPFHRRVLVPLLAKATPGDLQDGFMAVTLLASWAAGTSVSLLARHASRRVTLQLAGLLLFFSLGWGLKFAVGDFWIPDATVLAFTAAALLSAIQRRPVTFAVTAAVGVFAKESLLFVLPLYYTLNAAHLVDRQAALRALAVGAPAVAVYLLLQVAIPARNGDEAYFATMPEVIRRFPDLYEHYDLSKLLHDIGYRQRYFARDWVTVRSYTVEPFGIVAPVLIALGWRRTRGPLLRLAPFLLLVYTQLLFATDTQRLIVLAGPALCWLAVLGAEDAIGRGWLNAPAALIAAAGAFVLTLADDSFSPPLAWQAGIAVAMLAVQPASVLVRRRRRSGHLGAAPAGAGQTPPP